MSIVITGFTESDTDPFVNISGTSYYAGLSPTEGSGPYYYNTGNIYIFQEFGDILAASGTILIPYDATINYYLVGGGGSGTNYNLGIDKYIGGAGGKYISGSISIEAGISLNLYVGGGGYLNNDGGQTSLSNLSNNIIALGGVSVSNVVCINGKLFGGLGYTHTLFVLSNNAFASISFHGSNLV